MNATERNVENIVAIDLGKFNSAVCIFKKSTFKSNFRTIKTNGQDFHDLFIELEPDVEGTRTRRDSNPQPSDRQRHSGRM